MADLSPAAAKEMLEVQRQLADDLKELRALYGAAQLSAEGYGKAVASVKENAAQAAADIKKESDAWAEFGKQAAAWAKVVADEEKKHKETVQAMLKDVAETRKKEAKEREEADKKAQQATAEMAKQSAAAYQTLAGTMTSAQHALMGWVRAGMEGTGESERMRVQLQMLHREFANAFAPVIQTVNRTLAELVGFMRSLSAEQQAQIRHWAGIGAAVLAVTVIGPRIVSQFTAIAAAAKTLVLLNPFAALAAGAGILLASTSEGQDAILEIGKALMPVAQAFGEIARELAPVIADLAKELAPVVKDLAKELAPALKAAAQAAVEIAKAMMPLVQALGHVFVDVLKGAAAYAKSLVPPFIAVVGAIAKTVDTLRPLLDMVARLAELVGSTLKMQFEAVGAVIETSFGILEKAADMLGKLTGGGEGGRPGFLAGILGATGGGSGLGILNAVGGWLGFGGGAANRAREEQARTQRSELTPRGGGAESVENVYWRITAALHRIDSPELREAREQTGLQRRINDGINSLRNRPAVPAVTA